MKLFISYLEFSSVHSEQPLVCLSLVDWSRFEVETCRGSPRESAEVGLWKHRYCTGWCPPLPECRDPVALLKATTGTLNNRLFFSNPDSYVSGDLTLRPL